MQSKPFSRTILTRRLMIAAISLALCMVLPLLTGQIKSIGKMLCPMHLPVLLCGFLCGPFWGAAVGLVAPLLRSLLFSMPKLFPNAVCMAVELCGYGFLSGLLYRLIGDRHWSLRLYGSLLGAMIGGRLLWGAASFFVYNAFTKTPFTLDKFLAGAVLEAIPGILLQLLLIPPLVRLFEKTHISTI